MKFIKTLALVFILISSWVNSNAQTKEETEKWIVEKINKLKSNKYIITKERHDAILVTYRTEYSPGFIEFKDGILTIRYTQSVYTNFYPEKTETKEVQGTYTLTAPVNSVSSTALSSLPQSSGNTTRTGDTYLYLIFSSNCVTEIENNGVTRKINFIPTFIDPNAEEDIANRLLKAFNNLKTFYPKPKETF